MVEASPSALSHCYATTDLDLATLDQGSAHAVLDLKETYDSAAGALARARVELTAGMGRDRESGVDLDDHDLKSGAYHWLIEVMILDLVEVESRTLLNADGDVVYPVRQSLHADVMVSGVYPNGRASLV